MRFVGIDPSTKTGFVALDKKGKVLTKKEIKGKGSDPKRMVNLVDDILKNLKKGDLICIEGFSFGSKGRGISFQFGLGHAIRNELYKNEYSYTEVSPGQLKKFATGKGNTPKDNMVLPIYKKWKFESNSDNIRDAYVLAQIAKSISTSSNLLDYQKEVIERVVQ